METAGALEVGSSVIEKLAGVAYEQHVREAVLKPCGVTGMRIAGNTLAERAPGEVIYYGAGRQNPYDMNVRRMDSHGGWLATVRDLAVFASHVDGHSTSRNILEPGSIREMTTAIGANAGYAKGWTVNRVPNWWHGGSLPGTTSIMVRTASGFCWAALADTQVTLVVSIGSVPRILTAAPTLPDAGRLSIDGPRRLVKTPPTPSTASRRYCCLDL